MLADSSRFSAHVVHVKAGSLWMLVCFLVKWSPADVFNPNLVILLPANVLAPNIASPLTDIKITTKKSDVFSSFQFSFPPVTLNYISLISICRNDWHLVNSFRTSRVNVFRHIFQCVTNTVWSIEILKSYGPFISKGYISNYLNQWW